MTARDRSSAGAPSTGPATRLRPDYWDIIEAALTAVPESYRGRADALAAFDHLKERVLTNHAALLSQAEAGDRFSERAFDQQKARAEAAEADRDAAVRERDRLRGELESAKRVINEYSNALADRGLL